MERSDTKGRSALRPQPGRNGTVRTGAGLLLGAVAYALPFGAVAAVLLPARIAVLDPSGKTTLVAMLAAGSALAGLVGNIVFGLLSDLTRTRLESRAPWIVVGVGGGASCMLVLAGTEGTTSMLLWWCLAVASINAVTVAVIATLPDRVPRAQRATFSAVVGSGVLLGAAAGTSIGAAFLAHPEMGVVVCAAVLVAFGLLSAALLHGRIDLDVSRPPEPRTARGLLLPRGVPDFYRALGGRLLLVLGYHMVYAYKLYIVTDHLHLGGTATARAVTLSALVLLVSALIGGAVAGRLSDRGRRRRPYVVGSALLLLVATAAPLMAPSLAGLLTYSVLGGVAFGVFYAVDAALMSEVLPSTTERGLDLGVLNIATVSGQLLGPAASAAVLALGLGFGPVFLASMLACVLGATCLARIRSIA